MMEQNPFPEERKKREKETSTGTPAGTRRSQQIMREQRLFLTRIEKFSLIALKNFIYE
jgi:hypothetical protein